MKNLITITLVVISIFVLTACSSKDNSELPTAQTVIDKFNEAGLNVGDVQVGERDPDSPLPNSYQENLVFSIPEVTPKGGQVFVCDTKKNCDALYAYFDALKALAGPYLYQSPSGTVVAQLNSGLTPDTAAKFEKVIVIVQGGSPSQF